MLNEGSLEGGDLAWVNLVQEATDTAVDDGDLVLNGHGHVLALLQQLSQPDTSVQQLLGGGVKIGTELGEGGDLTVLASSSFMEPATCFMDLVWAAEPTRDTERPTLMAGRIPL